jgi:predicted nucleotidyltransferase component of viral defense system
MLASLDDIATMKLSAVAQRGSKKDFLDVYALLKRHASLTELLNAYVRRYKIDDDLHLLQALSYFDDADPQRTPALLWKTTWPNVRQHIQDCIVKTSKQRQRR